MLDILNQMNAARGGEASSQTFSASGKIDFGVGRSVNTGVSNLTISSLIGDLSRFQLAIDRVKNERIQMV